MGHNKVPAHLSSELVAAIPAINQGYYVRERNMNFPATEWSLFCRSGLAAACLPANLGGAGQTHAQYAAQLQELGKLSEDNGLNFALMAHALSCVWPLYLHAKTQAVVQLLPAFARGEKILANAMTEEQGGSDVNRVITTAQLWGDGYLINGKKTFCTNGPVASHALVYACTSPEKGFFGGISLFLVDLSGKGVKVGPNFEKMGLRTAMASVIELENVEVHRDYMIGKEGAGGIIFQESMVLEKIYMSAAHTGTLERWLEHMRSFAAKRKTGVHSLLEKQSVSHQLAGIRTQLEAAKALVKEAVSRLENSNSITTQMQYAALVKYFVSKTMTESAQKYLHLFGGKGYLSESGIEVQVRDFMASTLYSGTSEIQMNMIGSGRWH